MYGGIISNNTVEGNHIARGGGVAGNVPVFWEPGNFIMYDGIISNNTIIAIESGSSAWWCLWKYHYAQWHYLR
jgi:hypothetical protein